MEDLEERILQYPTLSRAERQAVEERVAERPEQAALLADVKALDRLLGAARPVETPRGPGDLNEEGRARCLHALGGESADPTAHLEARARDPAEEDSGAGDDEQSNAEEGSRPVPESATGRPARRSDETRPSADDEARSTSRWRYARYVAVAAGVVLVLYGALWAASRFSQSPMERLARVEGERLSVEGYGRMRGGGSPADTAASASLDERYLRGLRTLRDARTAPLGLFPRYEAEPLRRATRTFRAVAREAEAESFVQLEALFFLGKARLARGDRAGATRAFRRVVAGGGRLAPEAQEILGTLHEEAAYDGPPGGGG
ncbi:MAG: hypothetical protein BRD48_03210 [Bacteroidetes bacterium QS_9_68_14]|nr:MAG: hypothetical protein BRD48_03210 [Bacteroidetes bacterium QS_9_68_14]